jgi:hypothetical protein
MTQVGEVYGRLAIRRLVILRREELDQTVVNQKSVSAFKNGVKWFYTTC